MVISCENKNIFQQNKNMFLTEIISVDAMEHIFHRIHRKIKTINSFMHMATPVQDFNH